MKIEKSKDAPDIDLYDQQWKKAINLMELKNSDYKDAWRKMAEISILDIMLSKIERIKQLENNYELSYDSILDNYMDIINYSVFILLLTDRRTFKI